MATSSNYLLAPDEKRGVKCSSLSSYYPVMSELEEKLVSNTVDEEVNEGRSTSTSTANNAGKEDDGVFQKTAMPSSFELSWHVDAGEHPNDEEDDDMLDEDYCYFGDDSSSKPTIPTSLYATESKALLASYSPKFGKGPIYRNKGIASKLKISSKIDIDDAAEQLESMAKLLKDRSEDELSLPIITCNASAGTPVTVKPIDINSLKEALQNERPEQIDKLYEAVIRGINEGRGNDDSDSDAARGGTYEAGRINRKQGCGEGYYGGEGQSQREKIEYLLDCYASIAGGTTLPSTLGEQSMLSERGLDVSTPNDWHPNAADEGKNESDRFDDEGSEWSCKGRKQNHRNADCNEDSIPGRKTASNDKVWESLSSITTLDFGQDRVTTLDFGQDREDKNVKSDLPYIRPGLFKRMFSKKKQYLASQRKNKNVFSINEATTSAANAPTNMSIVPRSDRPPVTVTKQTYAQNANSHEHAARYLQAIEPSLQLGNPTKLPSIKIHTDSKPITKKRVEKKMEVKSHSLVTVMPNQRSECQNISDEILVERYSSGRGRDNLARRGRSRSLSIRERSSSLTARIRNGSGVGRARRGEKAGGPSSEDNSLFSKLDFTDKDPEKAFRPKLTGTSVKNMDMGCSLAMGIYPKETEGAGDGDKSKSSGIPHGNITSGISHLERNYTLSGQEVEDTRSVKRGRSHTLDRDDKGKEATSQGSNRIKSPCSVAKEETSDKAKSDGKLSMSGNSNIVGGHRKSFMSRSFSFGIQRFKAKAEVADKKWLVGNSKFTIDQNRATKSKLANVPAMSKTRSTTRADGKLTKGCWRREFKSSIRFRDRSRGRSFKDKEERQGVDEMEITDIIQVDKINVLPFDVTKAKVEVPRKAEGIDPDDEKKPNPSSEKEWSVKFAEPVGTRVCNRWQGDKATCEDELDDEEISNAANKSQCFTKTKIGLDPEGIVMPGDSSSDDAPRANKAPKKKSKSRKTSSSFSTVRRDGSEKKKKNRKEKPLRVWDVNNLSDNDTSSTERDLLSSERLMSRGVNWVNWNSDTKSYETNRSELDDEEGPGEKACAWFSCTDTVESCEGGGDATREDDHGGGAGGWFDLLVGSSWDGSFTSYSTNEGSVPWREDVVNTGGPTVSHPLVKCFVGSSLGDTGLTEPEEERDDGEDDARRSPRCNRARKRGGRRSRGIPRSSNRRSDSTAKSKRSRQERRESIG